MNRTLTLALALALLAGCSTIPTTPAEVVADADQAPDGRLAKARTVATSLAAHPLASEVQSDLALVDTWIDRAHALQASEDDDARARVPLLLDAIEGQLVTAQSYLKRRDAEGDLEVRRQSYETRSTRIDEMRRANDQRVKTRSEVQQ